MYRKIYFTFLKKRKNLLHLFYDLVMVKITDRIFSSNIKDPCRIDYRNNLQIILWVWSE